MAEVVYGRWYLNKYFKSAKRFRYFQSMSFAIAQGIVLIYFFFQYMYGGGEWSLVVISLYLFMTAIVISVIVYHFVIKRRMPPKAIMFSEECIFLLNYRNQLMRIPHGKIKCYDFEYINQKIHLKLYFKENIIGSKEFIPVADREFIERLFEYLKSKEIPRRGMPMIENL
ncbi:hypothetical protein DRN97_04910 [Methanosarcinales archaeon]|nr:MAG: hypothetical protein DRN97_04910 [Methanosarcinales archaeon]